jgi:hypothetical protein
MARAVSHRLSRHEQESIVREYRSGRSAKVISRRLHCSTQSILNVLRGNGISPRRGDSPKHLPTSEEIAEETAKIRAGWGEWEFPLRQAGILDYQEDQSAIRQ